MIAVVGRNNESLIYIRKMFVNWGIATKDDYTKALCVSRICGRNQE